MPTHSFPHSPLSDPPHETLRTHKRLLYSIAVALCVVIACQLILVFTFRGDQVSDGMAYKVLAQETAERSSYYPDDDDVYKPYVFNPGYVNFLALFYRLRQDDTLPMLANIVLNGVMACQLYVVGFRLLGKRRIGLIAMLLYLLFPTYIADVTNFRSDLLFTTLVFGALACVLSGKKGRYALAGVLLALANFVRPVAIVFILPLCLYLWLQRISLRRWVALLLGGLIVTAGFGILSYLHTGFFTFQSTTGGVNLLIGAHDNATGAYVSVLDPGEPGYLPELDRMTYPEKDAFWRDTAIRWMAEYPVRYAQLIPKKLFYTYAGDAYAFASLYDSRIPPSVDPPLKDLASNLLHLRLGAMDWRDGVVLLNQALYLLLLAGCAVGAVWMLHKRRHLRALLLLGGILTLGAGMSALIVGSMRYHYPYLPVMMLINALLLHEWRAARRSKPA